MVNQKKAFAKQAEDLWERRDLRSLDTLRHNRTAAKVPDVLYFAGLALNALNRKRESLECWRMARELDPTNEKVLRALAYELVEQAPGEAADVFYHLVGLQIANADDFTCLAEIRIQQDRLGEARRLLEQSLKLDPDNSLALLAMATLYAQVRDASLTLDFLEKAARTHDVDLADLASDPQFEFLWNNPKFEKIVSV
jgi:tetratricopeptide (TPR) repeat protein